MLPSVLMVGLLFLSTPSARRATQWMRDPYTLLVFLSTPSARRATLFCHGQTGQHLISIHALREEGDGPGCMG